MATFRHVDMVGHLSSTKCIFPAIVTSFALKDEWEGQEEAFFATLPPFLVVIILFCLYRP